MSNKFTDKAAKVLNQALTLASEMGHTYIGSEHLLLALCAENESTAKKLLSTRSVSFDAVKEHITELVGTGEAMKLSPSDLTAHAKHIIETSAQHTSQNKHTSIGTEHILLAICDESGCSGANILYSLGVSPDELAADIEALLENINSSKIEDTRKKRSALRDCPALSQYGRDLTALARLGKLDPIIGREHETERVIAILSRRTKNNPCLIGEPGVGKTAVVEGLALRIADANVPETLAGKTIVTLDLASMIAGAKYRGEFEERVKTVMREAETNPDVILFIDEIHTLVGAGAAEGAVDAANILKPALARGQLRLIGATTVSEYRAHIEKDAALERRFAPVNIDEPSEKEAVCIIKGLRKKYESHHGVKITDEAITAAVNLSVRYIGERYLPDKAIDLIDEAASRLRVSMLSIPEGIANTEKELKVVRAGKEDAVRAQDFEKAAVLHEREKELRDEYEKMYTAWQERGKDTPLAVKKEDIASAVTIQTGIPVKQLESDESERFMELADTLKKRIIGQDAAIDAVADALRRGRVGLGEARRPIGSFIFLGPTGVGKTELSRAIADTVFGDKNALIRIDMSEYMDRHSTSKLIGSPPGYIGYGEGGQLTEKVRRKPYSVVLFDEIEKAHPDVFNLFLQILEDGTLTDAKGLRVSFANCIVIMTSNIGSSSLIQKRGALGFTSGKAEESDGIMQELRATFRPEFLNRVDEIIIFSKLGEVDIERITSIMLDELSQRAKTLGVCLYFSDALVGSIVHEGYDAAYGARPLRRIISKKIGNALAGAMLDGSVSAGMSVRAELDGNGKVIFSAISEDL